jgi:hypothetical protein
MHKHEHCKADALPAQHCIAISMSGTHTYCTPTACSRIMHSYWQPKAKLKRKQSNLTLAPPSTCTLNTRTAPRIRTSRAAPDPNLLHLHQVAGPLVTNTNPPSLQPSVTLGHCGDSTSQRVAPSQQMQHPQNHHVFLAPASVVHAHDLHRTSVILNML